MMILMRQTDDDLDAYTDI